MSSRFWIIRRNAHARRHRMGSQSTRSPHALIRRTLLAGTAAGAAAAALGVRSPFMATQPLIARAQDVPQGGTLTYGVGFDVDDTLDPQVTNYDSTIRIMLN